MSETLTVAVTGATGFVGRAITGALLQRGHRVRALVRSVDKAQRVLPEDEGGLELIQGDVFHEGSAEELLSSADACIHLIGIIREPEGKGSLITFDRMHIGATEIMAYTCEELGVHRYLQMSALGADPDGKAEYQTSKFAAEQVVRHTNLDWTIFRPSSIHGRDGEFMQMVASWVRGESQPWIFLPYFTRNADSNGGAIFPDQVDPKLQPIAVDDVAHCFVEALTNEETIGEVYPLVGREALTWPEFLTHCRNTIPRSKASLSPHGIPGVAAAGMARAAAAIGLRSLLPFDEGMAHMGSMESTASLDKLKAHFEFEPGAFREDLAAYAGQL